MQAKLEAKLTHKLDVKILKHALEAGTILVLFLFLVCFSCLFFLVFSLGTGVDLGDN